MRSNTSSQGHAALLTPALSRLETPRSALQRVSPQLVALIAALFLTAVWACAQPLPAPHQPPPPAPPIQVRTEAPPNNPASLGAQSALYSIGAPTDAEQLYLELINRARANPLTEALRLKAATDPNILSAYQYFNVNLNQFVQDMGTLSPTPPLAFHPSLSQAARLHSQDMFANTFQGHTGSDGKNPGQRITAQSYNWSTYGENVYAYSDSVEHGHAGFEVDWGFGPGGMQNPAGHRLNLHSATFREVGIGVVEGVNGSVGPQLVTQDFGTRFGSTPLLTGVAYYDLNGNGFYDLGEGLGGVRVDVVGVSFYAITADSGGYAVPVPGNGTYEVRFSAAGLTTHIANATIQGLANKKLDFVPVYNAPQLSGATNAPVGQSSVYTFSLVGAAVGYEWQQNRLDPFTSVLDAESGLSGLTLNVSSGYNVLNPASKATGSAGFHLAHPEPLTQWIELAAEIRPGTASLLTFASRLTWATETQIARAELSTDQGGHWQAVWSRTGTGNSGQSSFETVSVSLAAWAGQPLRVRFAYAFSGGTYYVGAGDSLGWHFDNIRVTNADAVAESSVVAASNPVTFVPAGAGTFLLSVRAQVGQRWLAWGPSLQVEAVTELPPLFQIQGYPVVVGNRVELEVQLMSGQPGPLVVEMASSPSGPWLVDATATLQSQGASWRVSAAQGPSPMSFYRVRSQ